MLLRVEKEAPGAFGGELPELAGRASGGVNVAFVVVSECPDVLHGRVWAEGWPRRVGDFVDLSGRAGADQEAVSILTGGQDAEGLGVVEVGKAGPGGVGLWAAEDEAAVSCRGKARACGGSGQAPDLVGLDAFGSWGQAVTEAHAAEVGDDDLIELAGRELFRAGLLPGLDLAGLGRRSVPGAVERKGIGDEDSIS